MVDLKLLIVLPLLLANCFALYGPSSDIIELTESNFDKLVIRGDEIWIVEFFAPWCGHCQSLAPEYKKAATQLKGVVKVGAVNADEQKGLASRFNVPGFPTIKIFGSNKYAPEDYNGQRNAQGLIDAALIAIKNKVKGGSSGSNKDSKSDDVIELTDSNFDKLVIQSDDMWLVEFFAPWCGHCKNLAPHWSKAATELKGKVKLGALDATVHQTKAAQYGVKGYPTIKFFNVGKKSVGSAEDYDGARTSSDIVTWALEKLSQNVPPPEIVQITNELIFKENCDKPLCVIAVLPHILDCQSECRNDYIKTLTKIGERYKQKMWGWLWSEAGAQSELEAALDIGGFGYPAMVVMNSKKLKYSILRGSFSDTGITEFLRDLSYGKGNTASIRNGQLPAIEEITPWDGKDAELPPEEDIDLSDVDLNEKEEL
ncbi:hypothetical protein WA026_004691 [Henosepilachna vigintioctopunctata]|uniref:protein disulfide-isomerase n=1 Tax=Henosepilachna vigintioctopunctata TaxID=420089 RepID=A0AAW1V438_9CUCU